MQPLNPNATPVNTDLLPGLPLWALFPAVLLVLGLSAMQALRSRNVSTAFLCVAIGLRSALDAMHAFTFRASPAGLSYNAIASVAIVALGLLVIRLRQALWLIILPVVPLLLVMLASTAKNHGFSHAFTAFTKYAYLLVLAIAVYQAAEEIGARRLMGWLLPLMMVPLGFQILAIPLHVTKAGEADGSVSYIGGFHHEAAFSLMILSALLVICFADRMRFGNKVLLIAWCGIGLFLANYRTTILAAGPLLAVTLFAGTVRLFVPEQRNFVAATLLGLGSAVFAVVAVHSADRFSDLATVASRGMNLIQAPRTFSFEDRHLLSGRVEIWSNYIYAWKDGSAWKHAIGFGPESWVDFLHFYAHNTLVSALYETGILGVIATLVMWAGFLAMTFKAPAVVRPRLIAAHLSYFILNFATMPFWMIEGLIYYSVLCGITVHYALMSAPRAARESEPVPHRPLVFAGA